MYSVAPRTGPDEIDVAEAQHEYRQLVAVPYMLDYAEGLPPAFTLLTVWRFSDEEKAAILGVSVEEIAEFLRTRRGEALHLAVLTFGQPLQPLNLQIGPHAPTNWIVATETEGEVPRTAHRPDPSTPQRVFTQADWDLCRASVTVGDAPDVHMAKMALSNYSLPDGHPNKLTWADVDALRAVHTGDWHLNNLADRIVALLPPRT